jgi:hypothetical protein
MCLGSGYTGSVPLASEAICKESGLLRGEALVVVGAAWIVGHQTETLSDNSTKNGSTPHQPTWDGGLLVKLARLIIGALTVVAPK